MNSASTSSRLKPNVVCVRSFVPKEKKSAFVAISSAVTAARGSSIMVPIVDVQLDALLGGHLGDGLLGNFAQLGQLGHHGHQRDHDLGLAGRGLPSSAVAAAVAMARTCMTGRMGYTMPRRQPRRPSIGLASAMASICSMRARFSAMTPLVAAGGLQARDLHVERAGALQELVQRRVEQAHDDRQAVHGLEHAVEVARLSLEQLRRRPSRGRPRPRSG